MSDLLMRRYVFKLYPSRSQADALDRQRRMHCALYNALLQQRIEAYARCVDPLTGKGKSLSFYDQSKEITQLRHDDDGYRVLSFDSLSETARRVDLAFKSFFRRAKAGAGAASGFPRFKSSKHYPGFDFRYGRGCKLILDPAKAKGRLKLQDVPGAIRLRGRFPAEAQIKTATVSLRDGVWWISFVVEMQPRRWRGQGHARVTINLIEEFARVEVIGPANGECLSAAQAGKPLNFSADTTRSGEVTGKLGGDDRASGSASRSSAGEVTGKLGGDDRVSNAAKPLWPGEVTSIKSLNRDELHRWTTQLQRRFGSLDLIIPRDLVAATATGRGTVKDWGAAVKTKAALNRHVLDQRPGLCRQMLEYKFAEAGGELNIIEIADHDITIGNTLVAAAKAARKARAAIQRRKAA